MAGESGQVAEVIQQEGDRVLVSVPMVGFPPGFKLRPGERVVLVHDEKGPAVRPLVRAVTVEAPPEEAAGALTAGEQRYAVQDSAVREDEGGAGPHVIWVVEPGSAKGPEQVIAVRRE